MVIEIVQDNAGIMRIVMDHHDPHEPIPNLEVLPMLHGKPQEVMGLLIRALIVAVTARATPDELEKVIQLDVGRGPHSAAKA